MVKKMWQREFPREELALREVFEREELTGETHIPLVTGTLS